MSDISINYKGSAIATMNASGTKTLLTEGKYCEDDIEIEYVKSGGGGSTLGTKTITANDTYDASDDDLDGYSQVTVNVPASAVDTGTKNINTNGTHDVTGYAAAAVAVPPSAVDVGTIAISTNGTHSVVGYASASVNVPASAVDSGTKSITANGNNQDVVGYAAVNVNVPNSYAAGDEGKVVSNGALVAQGSDTVTQNGTVDTTLISSLTVNVSGGGGTNYLNYATKISFGKNFPSATPDISLPLVTEAPDMFAFDGATCPYTSIKVTFGKQITSLARMCSSYSYSSGLTSVEINGDFSKVTQYQDFVKANSGLQEIKGSPLDFSSVTNANFSIWSGNAQRILTGLTYVRYEENTLKVNHTIFCTALSDDSLVSIANGLQAGAHTLTLQTEMKNRLPLIMGTVANNGSYDVFTKDSQGSVTLQSFIATTKGWTIA